MAVGNTFGATALSSYGGFWIAFAIVLTPGGFAIETSLVEEGEFYDSFFFLFFTLDMAFLLLGIGYLNADAAGPQGDCIVAGGAFGLMAAFAAWYNALAGIADSSNRSVFDSLYHACDLCADSFFTASSSSPWLTSPGLRRAASVATRLTTRLPVSTKHKAVHRVYSL